MKDLNRIKVVLVEKKRTAKWLAEELGKNPATVSKWCTNVSQPDLYTLDKIAIFKNQSMMQYCDRLSQLSTGQELWWQQRYVLPSVPLIGKSENCFTTRRLKVSMEAA